ncbi:hypothetical protein EDD15DRAFT_2197337 [Pisolithus albus]|nr:hypothetical protein EDD15DRAFT_2197337 [Pisolithus albus]
MGSWRGNLIDKLADGHGRRTVKHALGFMSSNDREEEILLFVTFCLAISQRGDGGGHSHTLAAPGALTVEHQSDAAATQTTGLCIVRHGGTFGIGGTSQVSASVPRGDRRSDEYQTAPSETVQSTLKWTLRPRVTMVLRPVWMPNPKLLRALRHLDQVLYSGLPVDRDDEDWAYKNGLKMKIVTEIKRISAESFGSKECGAMLLSIGGTSRDARLLRPLPAQ